MNATVETHELKIPAPTTNPPIEMFYLRSDPLGRITWVAPDGNSFQGPWTILSVPSFGQFSAQRKQQPTPTPTPCPPEGCPVGGIAELPDVAGRPLEAQDSSGFRASVRGGVLAAVAAGALALGGAAWYARRRRS